MKTNVHECRQVGRKTRKKNASPYSHRQKNVQPNDPRSNPKKKPRMGGRHRDGMDERQNPPPRRGWESRDGSKEKLRCEKNPRRDRSMRGLGLPCPDLADNRYSPHAKRMPPPGHRYPLYLSEKDPWRSEPRDPPCSNWIHPCGRQRHPLTLGCLRWDEGSLGPRPHWQDPANGQGGPLSVRMSPQGRLGPLWRSRGQHNDLDTPHDQADAACKTEARCH
jgi:hypothetical protein